MKRVYIILLLFAGLTACEKTGKEKAQQPSLLDPAIMADEQGIEALLKDAYTRVDGPSAGSMGAIWYNRGTNWLFGDVYADDAGLGEMAAGNAHLRAFAEFESSADNPFYSDKWLSTFDGIARCNEVLRVLKLATEKETISRELAVQIAAEARFLRAYFHFEAIKIWENITYLTEADDAPGGVGENIPWVETAADFQYALEHLSEKPRKNQEGRVTKYAAAGMLARVKLYQGDYAGALPLLNLIIESGAYSLAENYTDNFGAGAGFAQESVFQVLRQDTGNSSEGYQNSFDELAGADANTAPDGCCGLYRPSQNLVNTFKTKDGLPYLAIFGMEQNAAGDDLKSDEGLASTASFAPDSRELDPRLDWTVGRRGIPYYDWGTHPGTDWVKPTDFGSPFSTKKNVTPREIVHENTSASGWGGAVTMSNYSLLRYADVLLMAAECEVEAGNLDRAREWVNIVRARASNNEYWVKDEQGHPAANYAIRIYKKGSDTDPFGTKDGAREAVRVERRLELGLEGLRFWDLKRWGVAGETIDKYLRIEKRPHLKNIVFNADKLKHPVPVTVGGE